MHERENIYTPINHRDCQPSSTQTAQILLLPKLKRNIPNKQQSNAICLSGLSNDV